MIDCGGNEVIAPQSRSNGYVADVEPRKVTARRESMLAARHATQGCQAQKNPAKAGFFCDEVQTKPLAPSCSRQRSVPAG